jgi:Winged helix-turn-helix domain (DUF2582)
MELSMASPQMGLPELDAVLVGEFEELLRKAAASHRLAELTERGWKGAWTVAYERIGETAGAIWQTLSQGGPQTLGVLMQEVNAPESLFFMAVGWLSREGKLEFEPTDGDYTVWLR